MRLDIRVVAESFVHVRCETSCPSIDVPNVPFKVVIIFLHDFIRIIACQQLVKKSHFSLVMGSFQFGVRYRVGTIIKLLFRAVDYYLVLFLLKYFQHLLLP